MKFTTLIHKVEVLFNNISEQSVNLLVCQLWRKFLNWLTEAHLIANHNLWDFNQFSQFYKQLNQSYHDVASDIAQCEKNCQQINQKAFTPLVTGLHTARSLNPIWHDSPHCELCWAAVPTHPDECWRCGESGHFSKDCTKPQVNKSTQIQKIESQFNDQLFHQDFETQYFSSSDNDDFSENDLNSLKNPYVS